MKLVFLGPPGCGKGTQAELITGKSPMAHIATGDLFRREIRQGTRLGKTIEGILGSGGLVPDDVTESVVEHALSPAVMKKGFILDGFPRTVSQAQWLDAFLESKHTALDRALFFDVSHDVIAQRLAMRRVCSSCGTVYHLKTKAPRTEGICDRCGMRLIVRNDDDADIVKARLAAYRSSTEPLLSYYSGRGVLARIDAERDIEQVRSDIIAIMEDSTS